jgi:tetratricopeptide (TPR) repeat protein
MKLHSIGVWAVLSMTGWSATAIDEDWDWQLALGSRLMSQGRYEEARAALERAREQAEHFPPDDPRLAIALNNLGAVDLRLNEIAAADRSYRRSAAIWERRGDAVNTLGPVTSLAAVYLARGQYTAADALLRHALKLSENKLGAQHPQTAVVLTYLGNLAFAQRDLETAVSFSERSLAIVRANHKLPDPDVAIALGNLGNLYRAQKRLEESSRLYTEAVAELKACDQPQNPAWIHALNGWSAVYFDQAKYEEAEALLKQALEQARKTLGPSHPSVARLLRDYAVVMRKTKRKGEARKLEVQAAQIMEQAGKENGLGYTVDRRALSGFR